MNLNKFTKAELISKLKKKNSINKGFIKIMLSYIILFKSFLLKITLIALLLKIFRKYSLLRKIWTIISSIVMSIFGISLYDIYGSDFFVNILNIIRSTYVYSWFSGLFSIKDTEIPSKLKTINTTSTGNEKSSGMVEGIKKLIIKEPEIIEEDPIIKKRYVILGLLLILAGLTWWYYGDSISPIISSGINKFKRKPDDDELNNLNKNLNTSDGSTLPNFPNIPTNEIKDLENIQWWRWKNIRDRVNIWKRKDESNPETLFDSGKITDIELIDRLNKLKDSNNTPEINDLSKTEDTGRLYPNNPTNELLEQLSGEREVLFNNESNVLISQISNFLDHHDENNFPNNELKQGIYNTLRTKLLGLSLISKSLYNNLLEDENINNEINRFIDIENLIIPGDDHDSNTYQEVALASIKEQEEWSNSGSRDSSPKINELEENINLNTPNNNPIKYLTPKNVLNNLIRYTETEYDSFTELNKEFDNENIASSSKVKLDAKPSSNLLDEVKARSILSKTDLHPEIKEILEENKRENLKKFDEQYKEEINIIKTKLEPVINKVENEIEDKTSLLTSIKDFSLDKLNNLKNLITPKIETKPLEEEESSSSSEHSSDNALDLYFPKKTVEEDIIDQSINVLSKEIPEIDIKWKEINSRGKFTEINSPNISINENISDNDQLNPQSYTSNLLDDTDIKKEKTAVEILSETVNNWDEIKTNIFNGTSSSEKYVEIDFGSKMFNNVKSIHFSTNDGFLVNFDIPNVWYSQFDNNLDKTSDKFIWDTRKDDTNPLFINSELKEIIIRDFMKNEHSIYKNPKIFK